MTDQQMSPALPDQPDRKPIWTRWWMIVLYVVVGLVILGSVVGEDIDDDPVAIGDATTSTVGNTDSTQPASTTTPPLPTTTTGAETTTTTPAETTTTTGADDTDFLVFGDGAWIVGSDIEPGTYRNDDSSSFCFWQRLSGFSGEFEDVIANGLTEAIAIVTIEDSDVGFDAQDCGIWSTDLSPRTSSPEADFGDGMWIVGSDIAPGLWRNDDSSGFCFWQRLSGFSGEFEDVIANGLTEAIATVQISASDAGFDAQDCGIWTKIG